jgi:hypothetical protein
VDTVKKYGVLFTVLTGFMTSAACAEESGFLNAVSKGNDVVNGIVWGWPALILLALSAISLTVGNKITF